MPRIHRLPEVLANRIAAGEVVERPASVVKELAENALDAGARHIAVELRAGGTRLIVVADDGCGMEPEDAVLAVERFATSKISTSEDLHRIETMGFRGEALPSIGAVSRMRILTRPPDRPEGTLVVVEGGALRTVEPVGCPPGTRVEVADLFFNTPARRKFLSSTNTERAHCHDWVVRLAMARPDVAIKLVHDGQVLFSTAGTGDLLSVLATAYGANAAREFMPVLLETDDARIFGFVSGPRLMRATRQHQYFFVNGRFVRSRALSHAVTQAYGSLLPAGRYPVCALHLTLAPTDVDPNVHPTKIEVRFAYEGRVHDLAERAVREALEQAGLRPATPPALRPHTSALPGPRSSAAEHLRVGPLADKLDAREDGLEVHARPLDYGAARGAEPRRDRPAPTRLEVAAEGAPPDVQVLGQLARRYIVALSGDRLLLIDQHRAAERVLLDRLRMSERPAAQYLAVPVPLELSPSQAAAAAEHRQALASLGFDLEPFGPTGWLLRSVPSGMEYAAPADYVTDMLEELSEWKGRPTVRSREEALQALVACHAAVKAGQPLSYEEMRRLVQDLMATNSPAVCPHGDPVILTLSAAEIDRRFERRPQRNM